MITAFVLVFGGTYMCWIGWLIYKGHRDGKQFEKELQTMAEERRQALRWESLTAIEQADKLDRAVDSKAPKGDAMNIEELRAIAAEYGQNVEPYGGNIGKAWFHITKSPNEVLIGTNPAAIVVFLWDEHRFVCADAVLVRYIFEAWGLIPAKPAEQEPSSQP